jgi:hypothetical protein
MNNERLLRNILILIKICIAFFLVLIEYQDIIDRGRQLFLLFGYAGIVAFYSIWIASIISIIIIALIPNTYFKICYIIIFFFITIFGISYARISGSPLLYDNIYVLLENTEFVGNAFFQYKDELLYAVAVSSL